MRADWRRKYRLLQRAERYRASGFRSDPIWTETASGMTRNGGRSKYMPHIGAKERGRYA
jgi:hypothetical protein